MEAQLKKVDDLNAAKKLDECKAILDTLGSDPEVLWRRARLLYVQTTESPTEPSKDTLRKIFTEALELTEQGLAKNPNHSMLLTWKGICVNQLAKIEGINERIKKSYEMRDLWEKAIELDPKNDVALASLGIWCYTVTDLPDVKRAFAKTFFKTPPNSTYLEAVDFLKKSEQYAPYPSARAIAFSAKAYYKLKEMGKAKEYCEKLLAMPDSGYEIAEEKEEIQKILKKL